MKKLTLNRETLRNLTDGEALQVGGGDIVHKTVGPCGQPVGLTRGTANMITIDPSVCVNGAGPTVLCGCAWGE